MTLRPKDVVTRVRTEAGRHHLTYEHKPTAITVEGTTDETDGSYQKLRTLLEQRLEEKVAAKEAKAS